MFEIALALVPLLALLASLLLGHYPGHAAIVRLSERTVRRARAQRPRSADRPDSPRSHSSSGGLLIALGIAKRPPPLAA
jgi:hypothetical protein